MEEASSNLDEGNEEGSSFRDNEAKDRGGITVLEDSRISVSPPKRDVKRKRGRPAGGSMKKGKKSVGQVRRTRAHVVKKPAKICENESDESSSFDEKTNEEEISLNEGNDEIDRAAGSGNAVRDRDKAVREEGSGEGRHDELFDRTHVFEREERDNGQEEGYDKAPDIEMGDRHYEQMSDKPEKLGVTVDPVQAILMDMIPSLGTKKVETINPILHDERPADPHEPSAVDPNQQPVKKKKVSYKDFAAKLLDD